MRLLVSQTSTDNRVLAFATIASIFQAGFEVVSINEACFGQAPRHHIGRFVKLADTRAIDVALEAERRERLEAEGGKPQ